MKRAYLSKLVELGLFFVAVFLGYRLYGMWMPTESRSAGGLAIIPTEESEKLEPDAVLDEGKLQKSSFEIIAKRNLFNPKREEKWPVKKVIAPPPSPPKVNRPVPKKRVVKKRNTLILEGILIFGGHRVALVKDMAKPRDGVKRVEVGHHLDRYTVDAITEEKLILKEKEGTEKILTLYTSDRPKRRRHHKTRAQRPPTRKPPPTNRRSRPPNVNRNPNLKQPNVPR